MNTPVLTNLTSTVLELVALDPPNLACVIIILLHWSLVQSELLGQFRLIGDRALDVSGGRICLTRALESPGLTQNAYAEM